jgi:hypothetical protein
MATLQHPQPRRQFGRVDRLDQVVVGTGVQAVHAVGQAVARGQHPAGRAVAGAALAGQPVQARAVGQLPVDQPGVVGLAGHGLQVAQAGEPVDHVAFGAQVVTQAFTQDGIVLQQQHPHARDCGPGGRPARASGWLQAGPLQSRPMLPLTPRREPAPAPSDRPASRPGPPAACRPWCSASTACCCWPAPGSALLPNRSFVQAALKGRDWGDLSAWGFGAGAGVGVLALHLLLLAPLSTRWTAKPLLALMIVVSAFASFYMQQYGVYLDPTMLRNVLRTDPHEAGELLSLSLALHLLLYAVLPLLVLWRVRLALWSWKRSLLTRLGLSVAALAVLVATLLAVFQPFSSLMRNQKELRYLITPANVLWSLASVAGADAKARAVPRKAIGLDARPRPVLGHAEGRAAGAGGGRNRARGQLGPVRLCAPDHARAGHAAGRELQSRGQLRHQHRDLAALHVRPGRPARLRRGHASAAASRCCTCWPAPASA